MQHASNSALFIELKKVPSNIEGTIFMLNVCTSALCLLMLGESLSASNNRSPHASFNTPVDCFFFGTVNDSACMAHEDMSKKAITNMFIIYPLFVPCQYTDIA